MEAQPQRAPQFIRGRRSITAAPIGRLMASTVNSSPKLLQKATNFSF